MSIVCSICSDQLNQSEEIVYTKCAHVFHLRCLTTWLERSKSCPQCREKVTQNKIHKLYFTFSNNDTTDCQGSSVPEQVNNLKFQLLLKEKHIQLQSSENVTLKKQTVGLRQAVRKLESDINKKNAAIHALNEQIKYFKEESTQCEYLKSRIAHLKSKIGKLKPIQTLLYGPLCDVSELIQNSKDPDVLTKYISIMKEELIISFDKYKKLQNTVKRLKEEISKDNTKSDTSLENQEKQPNWQEKLAISETKNRALQKRIDDLEILLGIYKKYDISETVGTGSQSNSFQFIPLEGDSKTKNRATSNKSSIIKHTTKRKSDQVSAGSTKGIQDNTDASIIELNASNSDLELVSCMSSNSSVLMDSNTVDLIESNTSSSSDDVNGCKPWKKRRIRTEDNTTCTNVINLT